MDIVRNSTFPGNEQNDPKTYDQHLNCLLTAFQSLSKPPIRHQINQPPNTPIPSKSTFSTQQTNPINTPSPHLPSHHHKTTNEIPSPPRFANHLRPCPNQPRTTLASLPLRYGPPIHLQIRCRCMPNVSGFY